MKAECHVMKACLVGLFGIVLAGCGDSAAGEKDANAEASGGATTVGGAASTGGATATGSAGTSATGKGGASATGVGGSTATGNGGTTATGNGGTTATGNGGTSATGNGGTTATGVGGSTATGTGGSTATGVGGSTATGVGGSTATGTGGSTATGNGGTTDIGTGGTTDIGTGGTTDIGTGGTTTTGVTVVLAGDDVNSDGPLQTTVEENLSFSGGGHILVRPTDITDEPNTKHPVAIWGPGGGTPPKDYLMLLNRMASQGFVVVGIRESSGGSELMSAALDWLEDQNEDSSSPMYDRLILDRVGVFGHSMGGLSSEATIRADSRVTTALLDNSGDLNHGALVDVLRPVGIIYGEEGMERPNAEGDYDNAGNKGPCWRGMMARGGHGSGPWDGAGANVAWMRWHIGGENFRKDEFLGNGGDYNNTGIWTTQFKNWDDWKNWNE